MTKHTPGPWKTEKAWEDGLLFIQASDADSSIASVMRGGTIDRAHAEANAHLIAAAPELLKLAEKFLDRFDVSDDKYLTPDDKETRNEIRNIVAKARGAA